MIDRLRALLAPPADDDAWGFDPRFVSASQPVLDALYDRWWRVAVTGAEQVPATGSVLIVANRSGGEPWDAAMIATAVRRHGGRDLRTLGPNAVFGLPWAGTIARRAGSVPDRAANAERLLAEDHAVLAFPERGRSATRHRIGRFGRGEFVEIALRAGAPIVPCAVVATGPPPLPSRWRIEFSAPFDLSAYGPDAASDRRLVLDCSDAVRELIQAKIYENLVKR
jgi:1-acyl-sn-glycerol-3-phosphate acyltransferase